MARPLVVFDADDTLWRTQPLYDRARERMVLLLSSRGFDAAEVEAWERAKSLGYSMHRFPGSLKETVEHFLGEGETAWAAFGIGYEVFSSQAEPTEGIERVLERLYRSGFRLAMLTAGEDTVQQGRIRTFAHRGLFEEIRIVPSKTSEVFARLLSDLAADPSSSWMIGDSLRSDILPADSAGMRTIHYDTHNWAAHEVRGHDVPAKTSVVSDLGGVPDFLFAETGQEERSGERTPLDRFGDACSDILESMGENGSGPSIPPCRASASAGTRDSASAKSTGSSRPQPCGRRRRPQPRRCLGPPSSSPDAEE